MAQRTFLFVALVLGVALIYYMLGLDSGRKVSSDNEPRIVDVPMAFTEEELQSLVKNSPLKPVESKRLAAQKPTPVKGRTEQEWQQWKSYVLAQVDQKMLRIQQEKMEQQERTLREKKLVAQKHISELAKSVAAPQPSWETHLEANPSAERSRQDRCLERWVICERERAVNVMGVIYRLDDPRNDGLKAGRGDAYLRPAYYVD